MTRLTHLDETGAAQMVDVSDKGVTHRTAIAEGAVRMEEETLRLIIDHFDDPLASGELLLRFEVMMLEELGFGLDLRECAATGSRENLVWVSPKSGRAVSAEAGAPWAGRLLALPAFVGDMGVRAASMDEIECAFTMTGYFLMRHVWEPRAQTPPDSRAGFLNALARRQS